MGIKTKPFEAAQYFETREAQARLLDDALESGDSSYIAAALGVIAKARGMSDLAAETGLNRQSLYNALREGGNPTLDTVMRVTRALGVQLQVSQPIPTT